MLGISVSTWWAWAAAGKTPAAIKLSPGVTVWDYTEVMAFIRARKIAPAAN
ncbi:helix-turn-helix transcriptional regulator [Dyella halodurans]